ncbi:E3 ubiquitin-protein ligase TRIM71-like [Lingula anatina]|uniref:E3 ubiquitin-protein ligase TRIM71-like n=1 Tax=Lingula anatina TaxID=7574 RepID=A0A1S3IFB1_LINAN|nr:E3 ubiquitin-protein ligase TRIM71-like [Lingula anatina]|eukprot:XP_013396955.1 E3 ubiquitin-protein ligase TRIM71-like [Lingula anatina]
MASAEFYDVSSDNFPTCHVCGNEFADPRVLPCYHTFCLGCIAQQVAADGTGEDRIKCPVCDHGTSVPAGGLEKLDRNSFLTKAKDLVLTKASEGETCGNCESQIAESYCQDCRYFFCQNCRDKQHNCMKILGGHRLILVSELTRSHTHQGSLIKQLKAFVDATLLCENHDGEKLAFYCKDDDSVVCRECIVTKHKLHDCVDIADESLAQKEMLEEAIKVLLQNVHTFENAEEALNTLQKDTEDNKSNVMSIMKQQVLETKRELDTTYDELTRKAEAHATTQIEILQSEKDRIHLQKVAIDSVCGFAKQLIQHGTDTEVMAHAKNIQVRMTEMKNLTPSPPTETAELIFIKGTLPVLGTLKEIQPAPQMSPCAPCEQVCSEAREQVKSVKWLQTACLVGRFTCKLSSLWNITCCHSGDVYLVSGLRGKLEATSSSGEALFHVHIPDPRGVTVLNNDRLVVTCKDGYRVYTTYGKLSHTFGQSDMSKPWGVTVDNHGHILVCDVGNTDKHICVYDSVKYSLMKKIRLLACRDPCYIAVLPANDVIVVSDCNEHCVYGVTPQGHVVFQYGHPGNQGSGDGELYHPYGLCTDNFGHIFIADQWNHRVVALDSDGQFLRHVVSKPQVERPVAVAVDHRGHLLVAEYGGRVKTFSYVC